MFCILLLYNFNILPTAVDLPCSYSAASAPGVVKFLSSGAHDGGLNPSILSTCFYVVRKDLNVNVVSFLIWILETICVGGVSQGILFTRGIT